MTDTQRADIDTTEMGAKIRALVLIAAKQACLDQGLDDETATRIADQTVNLMEQPAA